MVLFPAWEGLGVGLTSRSSLAQDLDFMLGILPESYGILNFYPLTASAHPVNSYPGIKVNR
ncbi:hypothetical protein PROH_03545 [Prochlorothrix hollandica PCC 9006 = CALU 1027]|uniref:Uncharacterized protein n=1 Tax=Prochlorothrix hollandica PCC 9006 = CALU 1027 TaxID=317619 RepID=A0A0M2Q4C1_PROHO|nr:hypothetical protein PROH_03545 [Prochlorothrix hollandica PCC 9006 = CALU 1027]